MAGPLRAWRTNKPRELSTFALYLYLFSSLLGNGGDNQETHERLSECHRCSRSADELTTSRGTYEKAH